MNEPKIAAAGADAERLVRELLDAFKSLKTIPPPPACSSPGKDEQQPRAVPEEASERAFETETASEPVGKVPATSSVEPVPVTTTSFEALIGARTVQHEIIETIPPPPACSSPGKDEQQPRAVPEEASERAFETETESEPVGKVPATSSAEPEPVTTTPFEALIGARTVQHEIIEEFRRDHEVIERLGVTRQELQALCHACLLGSLTCRQDVLFMLRRIREGSNPAEPQAAVPRELRHIPAKNIESSMPDISEMTERIRCEALAKLTESDSLKGIEHRRTPRHFGVFSSALVLIAGMTGGCIRMVSNWRYRLSPKPVVTKNPEGAGK